jgi:predicted RecB family nuclease
VFAKTPGISSIVMDPNNSITAAVFVAFSKCPTKAHLLATGVPAPDAFFADIEARISSMYKLALTQRLHVGTQAAEPLDFGGLSSSHGHEAIAHPVDCETAVYNFALPWQEGCQSQKSSSSGPYFPVLFSPWEKPNLSDSLLLCFGALALSQVTGILPDTGILIYGDGYRHSIAKIGNHVAQTRQIIHAIGASRQGRKAPPLVLNRHCAVCDFQARCRDLAIERDDLSLLTAMTRKERTKCNSKGISTITQLSYGYRPRRRKRSRPNAKYSGKPASSAAPVVKNDHKLKALAIKKSQIHVVGAPSLKLAGVPTFLDVEGMPGRDFYYLVGLRYECGGEQVERSFWADGLDGERVIWENCLRELKAIENAQIVSYGAYESRFLRQMKERYVSAADEMEFVDRLIETSVNLVSCIYGKIYFPTFSNSLKEVGRYFRFEWTWPRASGAAASLLRRAWELGADDELKRELIGYNMEDCRAALIVADAIAGICGDGTRRLGAVDVSSLEVDFQRTYGKLDCALPEFEQINNAAYWDYQRSKVYVRTDKTIRRTVQKSQERSKIVAVEKEVAVGVIPERCPKCSSAELQMCREGAYIAYDLKFMRKGIKRWVVRYRYGRYRCSECRAEMSTYLGRAFYGTNLRAFVVYLLIELRLSNQKAAEHASLLFDLPLDAHKAFHMKSAMAEKYMPTYRGILREIAKGTLIHADETKGVVKGGGHYIWVFANLTTVAYVYAESRESAILEDLLYGFSGVLVSDFYAAYDSVPCAQQKCLIHLMRDINEDLHKNPFDVELKEIAGRFGALLREIVETIDTYGLKARNLGKHRKPAARFIEHVVAMKCATEAGLALKKRIEKNRDKLFTFLDYDGVPWNNNNAEHAVRAFTRLRNVIFNSTPKGHREYATLLTIQQTLRCRGMGFLEFMRSGRMEIRG